MQSSMMSSLYWKDFRILRPFVFAVVGLLIALNGFLLLLWWLGELGTTNLAEFSVTIWILVPNLFLFGAPSLLVGGEEEAGTNAWLRTVPVPWQAVWWSRGFVTIACGAVIWLLALLQLWMLSLCWGSESFTSRIGWQAGSAVAFFSLLVLAIAFLCIYTIRSPLFANGAFLFAFLVAVIGCSVLFESVGVGFTERAVVAAAILAALCGVTAWLARRRMVAPIRIRSIGQVSRLTSYRAPRFVLADRPSPVASLMWQQVQQCWMISALFVSVSWITAAVFWMTNQADRDPWIGLSGGLAPLSLVIAASSLGALVFYGDNTRRRFGFFADRGISPSQLWWTRVLPPAIACVGLLVSAVLVATAESRASGQNTTIMMCSIVVVLFAFSQLVSQWVDRPLLAFFAGPAYTAVALLPLVYVIDRFDYPIAMIIFTVPVLLFATRRLMQPWLESQEKTGLTFRVLGYTGLALLLPCLLMIGESVIMRPFASQIFVTEIEEDDSVSASTLNADIANVEATAWEDPS
ncbi:MAG: hypothetical protein AAGG48_22180 [Planctomycetota bacterium]